MLGVMRSIPACAGEPRCDDPAFCKLTVYPRVCGGTQSDGNVLFAATGLSPRVRGNRNNLIETQMQRRSIPACAGEPLFHKGRLQTQEVYPRVCGGTW